MDNNFYNCINSSYFKSMERWKEKKMTETEIFLLMFDTVKPLLVVSGVLAFTLRMIVVLINMIIDAATGRGFRIGSEK